MKGLFLFVALFVIQLTDVKNSRIALELDPSTIAARVSRRSERDTIPLAEQTIAQAFRTAQESLAKSLLK